MQLIPAGALYDLPNELLSGDRQLLNQSNIRCTLIGMCGRPIKCSGSVQSRCGRRCDQWIIGGVGMDDGDRARSRFESTLRALRGRRLTAVDYWDVHNFGLEPAQWDYGDWHHAVMGIELGTDMGPVTVTWTDTFYPYGVEVLDEPIEHRLASRDEGPERVGPDGDGMRPWAPCLASPIRDATCHWERLRIGPGRRADGSITGPAYTVDVPVAVRLDFAVTAVWFVAALPQPPDARGAFIPADEIMVVFSPETMHDIGFADATFLRTAG